MSVRIFVFVALGMFATACSGSGDGGSAAATAPSGSLTLTITAAGVSPKDVTVSAGSQVTFVNNDVVAHEMFSDPHPEHTDCPELDQVGYLAPGQARQSGNLNTRRICGFHDHGQPFNKSLQGSITVQ